MWEFFIQGLRWIVRECKVFTGKLLTSRFAPSCLETGETTRSFEYGKCLETGTTTKSLEYVKCLETGKKLNLLDTFRTYVLKGEGNCIRKVSGNRKTTKSPVVQKRDIRGGPWGGPNDLLDV